MTYQADFHPPSATSSAVIRDKAQMLIACDVPSRRSACRSQRCTSSPLGLPWPGTESADDSSGRRRRPVRNDCRRGWPIHERRRWASGSQCAHVDWGELRVPWHNNDARQAVIAIRPRLLTIEHVAGSASCCVRLLGISGASYLRAAHHGPQCAPGRNAGRRISAPKREPRLRQAAKTSVASSSACADR